MTVAPVRIIGRIRFRWTSSVTAVVESGEARIPSGAADAAEGVRRGGSAARGQVSDPGGV